MASLGRKLIKSSLVRTLSIFFQIIVAFIMTPIIVHSLGDRMYGFWIFIGTFLGYYGLLDFGLSSAVTRYISRAVGENDTNEINKVVNTSFVIFSAISLAVLLLTAIVALVSSYFITDSIEHDLFQKIVVLLGISMAIGFPVRVFSGVLNANLRFDLIVYASISKLIVVNVIIIILLKNGFGILALASASFIAGMFEYSLIVIFAKKTFPAFKFETAFITRSLVKQLFNYSGKTFVVQLGDLLRFKIDIIVIAGYLNTGLVTYYSIGARFIEYFGSIMTSATGMMSPVFSQYEARGDYDSIRERFLEVTHFSVILSFFIGSSIIFYGKWFIARWMGPGYESSYYICVILCVSSIIALMQTSSVGLLFGISKHHFYAVANTCEGVLNLILSLILVRYYGIYGVALGTTIAMLVFKLFVQPVFVCRAVNLSLYKYYYKTIFVTAIKSLMPLLIYFYVIKEYVKADYTNILLFGTLQCMLFAIATYTFILSKANRQKLNNIIGFNRFGF